LLHWPLLWLLPGGGLASEYDSVRATCWRTAVLHPTRASHMWTVLGDTTYSVTEAKRSEATRIEAGKPTAVVRITSNDILLRILLGTFPAYANLYPVQIE
jgi:hypothetical protein